MPAVRAGAAEKWKARASTSGAYFESGVMAPRRNWKGATMEAKERHRAAVQESLSRDSFSKGVAASSDENWQQNTVNKGVPRFQQGVELSQAKYDAGFERYRAVIQNTTLPPRYPKGDPRNLERVKVMNERLRAAKVGSAAK